MIRSKRVFISAVVLMVIILACNMPGQPTGSDSITPTPNLTLTELFKPPENIATLTVDFSTSVAMQETPTATITTTSTQTSTVTATITPTQTQTPTETQTSEPEYSACYRAGEQFYASYFSSAPTIDGVWDEWTSTQYPVTVVNYGLDEWTDSDDLSASFRVGWDENYLYVAAKIGDDIYVQNAHGDNIYKGDSLEILFDGNLCGDYYYAELSADDYQLGISPGNPDVSGEKEAFMWFPRSETGGVGSVIIGSERSGSVTRVEAAIPWSVLGVYPWAGETFGFVFSVSDNDNTSSDVQQSMVTGVATRRLTNPTTWGTIILQW